MRIKLKVLSQAISAKLLSRNHDLTKILPEAYKKFKDLTPFRSGNAKRKTRKESDAIVADYPYAQRLDKGWSRQAPNGMSKPTIKHIGKKAKDLFK